MKRFIIFALLWPPIGMFVGATLTEAHGDISQGFSMTTALIQLAYLFLIGPALGLAFVDWWLADNKWRLPTVCIVAAAGIPAIFAHGSDAEKWVYFSIAGLVPTLICSLLANYKSKESVMSEGL